GPVLEEELVVIATDGQQLARYRNQLTLRQLANLPQILFSDSYDLRATTMDAYRQQKLEPNVVLEGAEMDAVLRFVERGLGVAVVPATVLLDRPNVLSCRLTVPALARTISFAHRRDVTQGRAVRAIHELNLTTVQDLAKHRPAIRSLSKDQQW